MNRSAVFLSCFLVACAGAPGAQAQTVEDFYRGKTLRIIASTGAAST